MAGAHRITPKFRFISDEGRVPVLIQEHHGKTVRHPELWFQPTGVIPSCGNQNHLIDFLTVFPAHFHGVTV